MARLLLVSDEQLGGQGDYHVGECIAGRGGDE